MSNASPPSSEPATKADVTKSTALIVVLMFAFYALTLIAVTVQHGETSRQINSRCVPVQEQAK